MVIVKLCGGLGNQLFQYAAARSLASILKVELALDLHWYDNIPNKNTIREYLLDSYNIKARTLTSLENTSCSIYHSRIRKKFAFFSKKYNYYQEKSFDYDNNFFLKKSNTYLDGYWQSPKYFENIGDIIREEFECLENITEIDASLIAEMRACNSVSVHFRGGDYITNKSAAKHHGVCHKDYYIKAIEKIKTNIHKPIFYIFSDDMQLARDNLYWLGNVKFIEHNGQKNPCHDLRLMSNCKHHIIANSSFSWWGAWLGMKYDTIVVAPSQWFKLRNTPNTLLVNSWLKI